MASSQTGVIPVKNYIPEELHLERKDYEEAIESKRGMEDSELRNYYDDEVIVYEVEEALDGENVKIPDLVIEKQPNRSPEEITNGILADELGGGVDVLYLRRDESGDVRYGMEFCRDHGMFRDIEFNGFPDFLHHVEAVGEAYGPLYDAGIIHDDLIGMRRGSGRLSRTPYIRNIMVSGATGDATMIDFEDAHFQDEPRLKASTNGQHILEMEPETVDEEYFAIVNSLIIHGILDVDHFEKMAERPLEKTDLLAEDPRTGLDYFDKQKLGESEATNPKFMGMVREVEDSFEEGFHHGQVSSRRFYEQMKETAIPVDSEREQFIEDAAKKRRDEDINPQIEEWLQELEE